MDPSTASYFRALLFTDGLDTRPLPPTLVLLYGWAVKRNLALGLGGMITKAIAFNVALTWLSTTKEGRAFARENTPLGDLFCDPGDEAESTAAAIDWDTLEPESSVMVTLTDNKTTKPANFLSRRGNWVEVRLDGELRNFRTNKVQLAGV